MTWRSIKDDPPPKGKQLLLICSHPAAPKHRRNFMAVDVWDDQYDGGFGAFNSYTWPATHWWDFGNGQTKPEPPA